MRRLLPALLCALALAGCSAKAKKTEKDATAKRPTTDFPHSIHVDQGIECADCHAGIDKATTLGERHLPKSEKCAECHEGYDAPARPVPEPRLTFSHAQHLPQVKGKCDTCHKKLPEMGEPDPKMAMETCTNCHEHQVDFAQGRCRPCHVDLKEYFPVRTFKHAGDWLRTHGSQARPSAESCAQCHDQTYCGACHAATTTAARPSIVFPEEVGRQFIHRGDYVSRHTVEAQADPASCQRCHGRRFCEACHTQQNLTRLAGADTGRRPPSHTGPEWTSRRESGNFHGDAARRDVTACAACHDQGASSSCVFCHQVGGIAHPVATGGNGPHPRAFVSKNRNRAKDGMCMACHRTP
jgi:hypothetical protein